MSDDTEMYGKQVGFHHKDGLFFERLPDGAVRMRKYVPSGHRCNSCRELNNAECWHQGVRLSMEHIFDAPYEFASIIASVSSPEIGDIGLRSNIASAMMAGKSYGSPVTIAVNAKQ